MGAAQIARSRATDGNDNGTLDFPLAACCWSLIRTSTFQLNQQSQSAYGYQAKRLFSWSHADVSTLPRNSALLPTPEKLKRKLGSSYIYRIRLSDVTGKEISDSLCGKRAVYVL
jgi:hypothetical protein